MPQEDCICRKCFIKLTDDNKVKKQRLCRTCNAILCKEYKQKNKDKIADYNKKYKEEHKDEIIKYNHDYNILNRESIQRRHTTYLREKRKTDPNYKIGLTCRNRIKKLVKGQRNTSKLIDCSSDFLLEWLQSNFTVEMTFENHGTYWHIDHVIPCKHFDLTNEKQLKLCFHWSNLQPLKSTTNLSKKDTISKDEVYNHWLKVNDFITKKNIEAKYKLSDYESCITTLIM
jgi:hypothetical protein